MKKCGGTGEGVVPLSHMLGFKIFVEDMKQEDLTMGIKV